MTLLGMENMSSYRSQQANKEASPLRKRFPWWLLRRRSKWSFPCFASIILVVRLLSFSFNLPEGGIDSSNHSEVIRQPVTGETKNNKLSWQDMPLLQDVIVSSNHPVVTTHVPLTDEWPELKLLVPTFPGGFSELQTTLIRSVQFFWPLEHLQIVVVLDDTVYSNEEERDNMTTWVKTFFNKDVKSVEVRYNPRTNHSFYGTGWFIQQLIMFWADNFTDAEYVGFVDDDSLFSMAVLSSDIFDSKGRPRVFSRYHTGSEQYHWLRDYFDQANFAFGWPAYINAMAYFPVIVKRNHLPLIRTEILRLHPEYNHFDDFFIAVVKRQKQLSQFAMMFEYLWHYKRDEYDWHFEPDDIFGPYFRTGFPNTSEKVVNEFPYIATGSPADNGVTREMLLPFPRVCIHGSYISGGDQREPEFRSVVVSQVLRRGYCFSQPRSVWSTPEFKRRCQSLDVAHDMNFKNEWVFEMWSNPWTLLETREHIQIAHLDRLGRNQNRTWDLDEIQRLFGE